MKTLHPKAVQVVFQDSSSKWASSAETCVMEQAKCGGAFESVMHIHQKSKSTLCTCEVCVLDQLIYLMNTLHKAGKELTKY